MMIGDRVVVVRDPLAWGVGTVAGVHNSGRLAVEFDGGTRTDLFHPHELETHDRWRRRGWLSDEDFGRLRAA